MIKIYVEPPLELAIVVKVYAKQSRLVGGRCPTSAVQSDVGRILSDILT